MKIKNKPKKSLLENVGEIIDLAKEYKLQEEFFKHAEPYLEKTASFLSISKTQAALFSLVLEYSDKKPVSIGKIARAMDYGRIQMLMYMDDFDVMEKNPLSKMGHFVQLPIFPVIIFHWE